MNNLFKTKVIVVQAVQFDGTPEGANKVFDSFADSIPESKFNPSADLKTGTLTIPTGHGTQPAFKGDWVVKDLNTKLYSVENDAAFTKAYEEHTPGDKVA